MQKLYTVSLTAEQINLLMQLVEHEQAFYEDSEDSTDTAHYENCESVLNKLYNA